MEFQTETAKPVMIGPAPRPGNVPASGSGSPRHTGAIARRSRAVVPPQTPWQSPVSSAHARHAPCTSHERHSAIAGSDGSRGAGKNVSGSSWLHSARARHASSGRRSSNARTNLGSLRAAATSCGLGMRARVITHLPRGYKQAPTRSPDRDSVRSTLALCSIALNDSAGQEVSRKDRQKSEDDLAANALKEGEIDWLVGRVRSIRSISCGPSLRTSPTAVPTGRISSAATSASVGGASSASRSVVAVSHAVPPIRETRSTAFCRVRPLNRRSPPSSQSNRSAIGHPAGPRPTTIRRRRPAPHSWSHEIWLLASRRGAWPRIRTSRSPGPGTGGSRTASRTPSWSRPSRPGH